MGDSWRNERAAGLGRSISVEVPRDQPRQYEVPAGKAARLISRSLTRIDLAAAIAILDEITVHLEVPMHEDLAAAFAARYRLPLDVVQRLNAEVAERCALIANRYEPEGSFSFEQLSTVEVIGAEIGAAIMAQFPEPHERPKTAREVGWGSGMLKPPSKP